MKMLNDEKSTRRSWTGDEKRKSFLKRKKKKKRRKQLKQKNEKLIHDSSTGSDGVKSENLTLSSKTLITSTSIAFEEQDNDKVSKTIESNLKSLSFD